MIRILFIIYIFSITTLNGQQLPNWDCNQSNIIPSTIFYPNTSVSYSNSSIGQECMYLCGPNTSVYDTIGYAGSRTVFVNSGCIYYTENRCSVAFNGILAKNNSTVVIRPNSNPGCITIWYEPNATVVIQCPTSGLNTYSCASITFPAINCSTGLFEYNKTNQILKIWPNPTTTKIYIEFTNTDIQFLDIKITNQIGQVVFENKHHSFANNEIPLDNIPNGLYSIQVNNKGIQYTEKIVVFR